MSTTILEMKKIHKQFPGVYALKDVDFELKTGEVHGLIGENGAGKSTLMKVLAGIYEIDKGEMFIDGEKVFFSDVGDSQKAGVSVIHQELALIPHMSVAENIFLGRETTGAMRFIKKNIILAQAQRLLDSFSLSISASELVENLCIAQQQMVEIAKAISYNSKIIIMDEPTSSLTDNEVNSLFEIIKNLKLKGVGIVFISHRMPELFTITDRITVMRDGEYVGTRITKDTDINELVSMMVGRELKSFYNRTFHDLGDTILEVKNLTRKGAFSNISFNVRRGEIFGFAGLVGAGRTEIMKTIFGLDSIDSGEIIIDGKKTEIKTPNKAMELGIAFVPEDRKDEGLILKQNVGYNMTLGVINQFIKFIHVNIKKENKIINEYIDLLSIKTSSKLQLVSNLSGGNQQKVVISKWLANKPKIIILDEPTRGVDIGAKAEIYGIMNNLVKSGVAIIMISSEMPEVMNMCDRIAVVNNGRITGIISRPEFSQEKIMHMAIGGTQS